MVQHIAMSVPSTWDLSVKLGTICQFVKMVILTFSQSKTFTGEVMYNSLSTGATPTRINGTLRGSELRWRLAMLEYRGKLCRGGTQICIGSIKSVSPFYAGRLFLGTFTARRLPSPPGEIHGSTWCASLNISDDMLDVLYRNGASREVLHIWLCKETSMLASPQRVHSPVPQIVRIALLRHMLKLLLATCNIGTWYSAVSLLDMGALCFNGDRYSEALPLTSMASLRWVQVTNSVRAKMPLVEFMDCASSIAQWLCSTSHISEPPAKITIQQFLTEEKKKSYA